MKSKNTKLFNVLFITILLSFIYNSGKAQTQCSDGYLATPDVFKSYCKKSFLDDIYNNKLDLRTLKSKTGSSCWIVYSDRDENQLFYTKDGREKSEKLSFMERLVVKETNGSWLLIYSQTLEIDGVIKNNIERGWIKAKNIILSSNAALLNQKSSTKKSHDFGVSKQP